jgi:hypothetical protein
MFIALMTQDINPNTSNLCHHPFIFNLNSLEPGILRAESFKEGVLWASHSEAPQVKRQQLPEK